MREIFDFSRVAFSFAKIVGSFIVAHICAARPRLVQARDVFTSDVYSFIGGIKLEVSFNFRRDIGLPRSIYLDNFVNF